MNVTKVHEELREKNRDLELLSKIIKTVHKLSSLKEIYRVALDSVVKLENIDMVAIYVVDEKRHEAVLQAYRNLPKDYIRRARTIPRPKGLTWKLITNGKVMNIKDIQKEPYVGSAGKDLGHHSVLGIPIFLERKVIGVIWFASHKERKFKRSEVKLLSILGDQIALAITKAKMFEEMKRQELVLQKARDGLERTVIERSAELLKASQKLQTEIAERKRVEEALRENEENYRHLFENVPTGIYRTTPDGRILMANTTLIRMLGYSSLNELASRNLEREGFAADYPRTQFKELLEREGEVRGLESAWIKSDNSVIFIRENASAIRGEDGTVLYYEGTVEDITERKRTEEALWESEEKFRTLVEHSYDFIIETSVDGRFLYVNPKHKDVLGYEPNELLGKSIFEHIHPDDRPAVMAEFRMALATFSSGHSTFRYRCKNGEWHWFEGTGKPYKTAGGEIRTVIASHDVTERKRIEDALRESEERFRTMADTAPVMIWMSGVDKLCTYFNKGWLEFRGRTIEQELGNGWVEGVHPDDVERCLNTYVSAFDAKQKFKIEYRLRHFNGEYRWVLNHGAPRFLSDGSFVGYICSTIDITDRKQAEETLKESVAQLSKKKRYEEIISTVTQSVHQSINLQEVLENAVDAMSKNIDGMNNVSIYMVEGEEAVLKAYRGYSDWFIQKARRIPYPRGFTWKTIIDGQSRYCPDVDQDTFIGPAGREMGTKSYAAMPIHFQNKTIGTININSFQKNAFDEEELKLLEIVARQIEIAINNAQMAEALRRSKDELEMRVEERTIELRKTNEQLLAEITERKRAEEKVKTSLREKELLLKEIHHRVKNNLQVISSLLNLQSPDITDEHSQNILLESRNRIRSMALVHEQLYRAYDITQIDFHGYLKSLVKDLLLSYSIQPDMIKVNLDIQDILFDIETAIPCGLLINELISNCLKHAFPQGQKGEIYITLSCQEGNRYRLTVQDNGVGFPPELNLQNIKSLGLRLVMALTKQLQGDITLERSNGTAFHIDFTTVQYKERG